MIYLAAPYSHDDPAITDARYHYVNRVAGYLMMQGAVVFSPLSHSHVIAAEGGMPIDWTFWAQQDLAILARCDSILVLTIPGWQQSLGVQAEIGFAREHGIPVKYVDPAELPSPLNTDFPKPNDANTTLRN